MNSADFLSGGKVPYFPPTSGQDQPYILSVPYKGMILAQELKMLQIARDHGVFQLPSHQLCASLKDQVYLRSPHLKYPIIARVVELNTRKGWLTLSGFLPSPNPWKDRSSDRVQPERPVHLALNCLSHQCWATLDDLSLAGLGMLIYTTPEKEVLLKQVDRIRIDFRLPDDPVPYRMDGSLVFLTQVSHSLAKMGVRINPNRLQRNRMAKYINRRSMELLRELEMIWMSEQEPRGSKDLYF